MVFKDKHFFCSKGLCLFIRASILAISMIIFLETKIRIPNAEQIHKQFSLIWFWALRSTYAQY